MIDITDSGVIWNEGENSNEYVRPVPRIDRNRDKEHTNCGHYQVIKDERVVWTEDPSIKVQRGYKERVRADSESLQGMTRGFIWRDKELGIDKPILGYPDKPIPNLRCPDCSCQAVETDQIGVALCSGTPGWFFYYRQRSNGIGQPETKLEMVNGEMQEVVKDKTITIERQPLGDFKEINIKKEGEEDEEN